MWFSSRQVITNSLQVVVGGDGSDGKQTEGTKGASGSGSVVGVFARAMAPLGAFFGASTALKACMVACIRARFEGVAEGMFPESAIVTGLPRGVKEKNRDARLLSPLGLVDAYLKREVTITRTSKATGVVREYPAFITSAPGITCKLSYSI